MTDIDRTRSEVRIVERVRKLLALSRSDNMHEAAAAAEKARELMEKYKLTQTEVELKEEAIIDSFDYATEVMPWVRDLGFAVARGFFCRAIHTPRGKGTGGRSWLHFVGKPEDTETARFLFGFLRRELKRLAAEAFNRRRRAPDWHRLVTPEVWKRDFYNGAVFTIDGRLRAKVARFAEAPTSRSLVRIIEDGVEKKLTETFKELRPRETGAPIHFMSGWTEGVRAGGTVPLEREKTLPKREGNRS